MKYLLTCLILLSVTQAAYAQSTPLVDALLEDDHGLLPPQLAQVPSISVSLAEGWSVYLTSPVFLQDGQWVANAGVVAQKSFPLGWVLSDNPRNALRRLRLDFSASLSSPLTRPQVNLTPGVGLSHWTPLNKSAHFHYGIRYAPLYQFEWFDDFRTTGYQGFLGHMALQWQLMRGASTTLGIQGGYYHPYATSSGTLPQPFWVLQPILGGNLRF